MTNSSRPTTAKWEGSGTAIDIQAGLVRRVPESRVQRRDLAMSHNNLGLALTKNGHPRATRSEWAAPTNTVTPDGGPIDVAPFVGDASLTAASSSAAVQWQSLPSDSADEPQVPPVTHELSTELHDDMVSGNRDVNATASFPEINHLSSSDPAPNSDEGGYIDVVAFAPRTGSHWDRAHSQQQARVTS